MKTKLYCATLITALITLLTVFLANVGHTEYKSQMRKRKIKKSTLPLSDNIATEPLMDLTTTSANV